MHRKFPPQLVFDTAVRLVGYELNLIRNIPQQRPPSIVFAREAITGAMRDITHPQPSWPELAAYFGMVRHSSVSAFYDRFQRWFPRLRAAWLDMVRGACDGPVSDFEPELRFTPPFSLMGDRP